MTKRKNKADKVMEWEGVTTFRLMGNNFEKKIAELFPRSRLKVLRSKNNYNVNGGFLPLAKVLTVLDKIRRVKPKARKKTNQGQKPSVNSETEKLTVDATIINLNHCTAQPYLETRHIPPNSAILVSKERR